MAVAVLSVALGAATAGCEYELDLLGDGTEEPTCSWPECIPESIDIEMVDEIAELTTLGDPVVALGGQVELRVDGTDFLAGTPSLEVEGGDAVAEVWRTADGRVLIRPHSEIVILHAVAGDTGAIFTLHAAPVDRIVLVPTEEPFVAAAEPVDFAVARRGEIDLLVRLLDAAGRPLLDRSLVADSDALVDQPAWDRLRVEASGDAVELSLSADSGDAELAVEVVDATADAIVPVTGPRLLDPTQPIRAADQDGSRFCFLALAGGVALAGLEWRIDFGGPVADESTGCEPAYLNRRTTSFRMWAGEVGRAFQLQIEE